MKIKLICAFIVCGAAHLALGQHVESFGFFGGFNIPISIDNGLQKDPRFVGKVTFRATPIGFAYGYDHVGYGFVITPAYTQIGQKFLIKNTVGGDVGIRNAKFDFFSVPIALKLHINDMSFFRLSAVAALNFNFLISGKESITQDASKQRFPPGVLIPDDPSYVQVFDGVLVPELKDFELVTKDKFKTFQLFAAIGLRSDFDLNDDWSINFDGRANFGLFDPRTTAYTDLLKQGNAPELFGSRHEVYLSVEIGLARIIQIKKKFVQRKSSNPAGRIKPDVPKQNHKKILTKKKRKK